MHTRPIPRLGGVAIFFAWLIAAGTLLATESALRDEFSSRGPRAVVFVLGGLAAAALGCIDDLRGLRARYKLGMQLVIGLLLCWGGFTVHEVQLPGGMVLALGPFAVPFTVLWIAGVMNAMNLIDGLDGLAAGVAAIALAAVFVFAVLAGNPLLAVFSAALLGAVLGFLFFNFNPASIFMGDAGALLLGYFLAVALLRSSMHHGSTAMELLVPLLVLGVPLCDMVMAVCRRVMRGRACLARTASTCITACWRRVSRTGRWSTCSTPSPASSRWRGSSLSSAAPRWTSRWRRSSRSESRTASMHYEAARSRSEACASSAAATRSCAWRWRRSSGSSTRRRSWIA